MIRCLPRDVYFRNIKIINSIAWIDYTKTHFPLTMREYVFRISDKVYTENTEEFKTAWNKEIMWEKLNG